MLFASKKKVYVKSVLVIEVLLIDQGINLKALVRMKLPSVSKPDQGS